MISCRLAGIAPEEADRIISLLEELTTEESSAEEGQVHSNGRVGSE